MQKCPKCNHLNKNQTFCSKCGTKLPEPVTTSTGKTPMSKKTIIMAAAGVGVVVLATAFIFTGKAMADKEKVLDSFVEALTEGNVSKVKKHLASSNKDLKVTDQHAESLIAYMEQDEDAFTGLEGKWGMESGSLTEWDLDSDFYYYSYYEDFPVAYEKVGKTWLFFDKYAFVLEATPVFVRSETPDLSLTVDGDDIDTTFGDDEYYIGEYLPGLYQLSAKVDNDFGSNEKEQEMNVYQSSNYYMDFDLNTAVYTSENFIEGTKLILEDIDKELEVTSANFEFGPLLTDGTVSYHIESDTPFGKLSSLSTTIDYDSIGANLAPNDELKEELKKTVSGMFLSMRTAMQELDTAKLDYMSGDFLEESKDVVENSIDSGYYFTGYLNQIGIDWDGTTIYPSGTSWKASVPTTTTWEQARYYEGDTPELEEVEAETLLELTYSDESWKVTGESYYGIYEPTETYDFTHDEQNEASSTEDAVAEPKKAKLTKDGATDLFVRFWNGYGMSVTWGDLSYLDEAATDQFKETLRKEIHSANQNDDGKNMSTKEVVSVSDNEDESYTIEVIEIERIYAEDFEDEDEEIHYQNTYKAIYDEDTEFWLLDELIETKEFDLN